MGNLKRGTVIAVIALVAVAVIVFRNLFTLDDGRHQAGVPDTGQGEPATHQVGGGDPASQANGTAADTGVGVTPATERAPGDRAHTATRGPNREGVTVQTVSRREAAPVAGPGSAASVDGQAAGSAHLIPGEPAALSPPGAAPRTAAGTAQGDPAPGSPLTPSPPPVSLEQEARAYVRALAAPSGEPLAVAEAEGFVGPGRSLAPKALPTPAANPDPGHSAATTPPSTAAGTPQTASANTVETEQARADPGPLADARIDVPDTAVADQPVDWIPDRRADATAPAVVDLPVTEQAPVTIAELLAAQEAVASDAVFYVHTVQPGDDQGLWGIVHHGIVKNFAAGVALHRAGKREVYRVDIPPDADQIETADQSSSFLGKLIYEKSQQSYVYNYRTERLGRNPDLIFPGQQLVIVSFTPDELVAIYKHFARQG